MRSFADMQDAFQRAILERDDAVLAELTDGAQEPRTAMFEVYRNAYLLRLVETLRKDHDLLHAYLGDETFDEMAAAYITAYPSRHASVRWIARHLPKFLADVEPYSEYPAIADLGALEKALYDAFDAPDGTVLTGEDLASIPPQAWQDVVVAPHPSAKRLSLSTNATAIWSALRQEETPPDAETSETPVELLVWRQETPMWRELSREEAMMWDEAAGAMPFGQICVMLATFDDPENAAGRAAGYLGGWVGAGLLATATVVAATPPAAPSQRSM